MRVAVVGAGSWGTAVAGLAADHADRVELWARRPEQADAIETGRHNPDYLTGYELPDRVHATSDLEEAVAGAGAIVMGVPSHGFREVTRDLASLIDPQVPVISLAKGIEQGSLSRMTEILAEELPDHRTDRIGVLTGPNLAKEIAAGQPAAAVVAMQDGDTAARLQELFLSGTFRVYTNPDVVGCESAGALKNSMAIAAGMAHGLDFGLNTMSMLITRALAELTRLGVALGGKPLTFSGLAGMGDLIATCMSPNSRNHRVGYGLGQGRALDEIVEEMRMVAEGVKSTEGIIALAERHGVEMPIARQVGTVLYEGKAPLDAVSDLMAREAKPELHGIG